MCLHRFCQPSCGKTPNHTLWLATAHTHGTDRRTDGRNNQTRMKKNRNRVRVFGLFHYSVPTTATNRASILCWWHHAQLLHVSMPEQRRSAWLGWLRLRLVVHREKALGAIPRTGNGARRAGRSRVSIILNCFFEWSTAFSLPGARALHAGRSGVLANSLLPLFSW